MFRGKYGSLSAVEMVEKIGMRKSGKRLGEDKRKTKNRIYITTIKEYR